MQCNKYCADTLHGELYFDDYMCPFQYSCKCTCPKSKTERCIFCQKQWEALNNSRLFHNSSNKCLRNCATECSGNWTVTYLSYSISNKTEKQKEKTHLDQQETLGESKSLFLLQLVLWSPLLPVSNNQQTTNSVTHDKKNTCVSVSWERKGFHCMQVHRVLVVAWLSWTECKN